MSASDRRKRLNGKNEDDWMKFVKENDLMKWNNATIKILKIIMK